MSRHCARAEFLSLLFCLVFIIIYLRNLFRHVLQIAPLPMNF